MLLGIGLTLVLFVALQAAIFWTLRLWLPGGVTLPWLGQIEFGQVLSWGSADAIAPSMIAASRTVRVIGPA